MREVLFKKWIPTEWADENCKKVAKPGTNCWEVDFIPDFAHIGKFHQWAVGYEEFETGAGNYTFALIEDTEGIMHEVLPTNLKFIS